MVPSRPLTIVRATRIVHEEDQQLFSWNHWNRVPPLAFPATLRFHGVRKDGTVFQAETDMILLATAGMRSRTASCAAPIDLSRSRPGVLG